MTSLKGRPAACECQAPADRELQELRGRHLQELAEPAVVASLIDFKKYDNMRNLLCEVISFTLDTEQIGELRAEFERAGIELKKMLTTGARHGLDVLGRDATEDSVP